MNKIKEQFPIFKKHPDLIYFDNAATTQKPKILMDSITEYYAEYNSNIGRSVYSLAAQSEEIYHKSVSNIKKFFNTDYALSFSDGCTSSINEAAYYAKQLINKNKKYIILSIFEHHANIMIWQHLAKELNLEIYWIKDSVYLINPFLIPENIQSETALVALTQTFNVTGELNVLELWDLFCKKHDILFVVDGAQGAASKIHPLDVDVDFYAFSAHKIYGPMGLGGLFINPKHLNKIEPYKLGGGIIEDVSTEKYLLLEGEEKLNSGTLNIANIYAVANVLTWLNEIRYDDILQKETELLNLLRINLQKIPDIHILKINDNLISRNILSFTIKGIHSHDVGTFLDQHKIAVRVGKHCAHPFHSNYNISSSIRVSLGIYNNEDEILKFVNTIKKCISFFKGNHHD